MEKNIHFANAPICQSCGMPLTAPEQFGKNADGTTNGDYCVYCCPDGEANMTGTLDEMIDFCAMAGIPAMHSHFGFIPEDPSSEQYKDFIKVMQDLANYAKERDMMIYFETGQETPTTLIRAIKDIGTGNVFVNCDLANLLMYGKANSLDAVKQFGSLIKEFHAKDGKYPDPNNPYELGAEVPIPTGEVDFPAVIAELKKQGFQGALTIECELNGARHDYVVQTRKYLQDLLNTSAKSTE